MTLRKKENEPPDSTFENSVFCRKKEKNKERKEKEKRKKKKKKRKKKEKKGKKVTITQLSGEAGQVHDSDGRGGA